LGRKKPTKGIENIRETNRIPGIDKRRSQKKTTRTRTRKRYKKPGIDKHISQEKQFKNSPVYTSLYCLDRKRNRCKKTTINKQ
jgi:tRNA A-37 threonylcarbamoyl transferase component Bud32